jgi:hypothetical protein
MASTDGMPLTAGKISSKCNRWHCWGGRGMAMLTRRSNHPDVREKIQRVITQGHIDPEDFNGVSNSPVLLYTRVTS